MEIFNRELSGIGWCEYGKVYFGKVFRFGVDVEGFVTVGNIFCCCGIMVFCLNLFGFLV